jgi:hypothetical protein
MSAAEIAIASAFLLMGVRSLLRWLATDFEGRSSRDQVLFAVHATARVGLWFAFAGFFLGYALLDRPERFRWFVLVPLGLSAVQALSGILLSRAPDER